jgi:hypothetical protein
MVFHDENELEFQSRLNTCGGSHVNLSGCEENAGNATGYFLQADTNSTVVISLVSALSTNNLTLHCSP